MTVGIAALAAPALHSVTDMMEWYGQGFSAVQLWLNYVAFLPMPWLLFGLYVLHTPKPGALGLVGALLYGVAFTYFAHTTLYALSEGISRYDVLWDRLGGIYTLHGGLMVCGGLMFGRSALRAGWLPRVCVALFMAGLLANACLGILPAPDILQTMGSAIRNLGLMGIGHAILFKLD